MEKFVLILSSLISSRVYIEWKEKLYRKNQKLIITNTRKLSIKDAEEKTTNEFDRFFQQNRIGQTPWKTVHNFFASFSISI